MHNADPRIRHFKFGALALALCLTSISRAQSDACSFAAGSRYTVNTSCVFANFDKPTSFVPNLAPATCGGGNFDDAFGWFTATATTTTITYDPDDFLHNPVMHIYTGTCASLTYLTCANGGGIGANETITMPTVIGTNYLIRIQRSGTSNSMDGRLCVWSPPPPPANDNCANAIDLPVFDACFMQTFTNVSATASGTTPNPACSTAPSTDVWFRFVAPSSGAVRVYSETGTLTDGAFQLYTGSCGALSLVTGGCDDDGGVAPNANMPYLDRRCTPLTGGTTYYIRFWGYGGATGTFGLCVYGPDFFPTPGQDCGGGFTVCSSGSINNSSNWTGCSSDLNNTNRGCLLSNERQGTWYYFSPQATGNVGFTLQPTNAMGVPVNVDYDFALWGPMTLPTCPPASPPIRCSYADPNGLVPPSFTTGMAAGNTDTSEPSYNNPPVITYVNGFVAPITIFPVHIGQVFVLYLDNFSANGQSFNLNWSLSNPSQLDCTLLPISIIDLKATRESDVVAVEWTAQDIAMTDRFVIEHSSNGIDFTPIGTRLAGTTGSGVSVHRFDHSEPVDGLNFYRLQTIDEQGTPQYTEMVSVLFGNADRVLRPSPNPTDGIIRMDLAGFKLNSGFELRLIDSSGRSVMNHVEGATDVRSSIALSLEGLDSGYYVLSLYGSDGQHVASGRVVKQ